MNETKKRKEKTIVPRLDLETLDVNALGRINLADLRVTGQRNLEKKFVRDTRKESLAPDSSGY